MSPGINLLLIPFAVKCKRHPNWGVTMGRATYVLPICDHISYRTAVLCEMVRWWGEVRVMGTA